MAESEIFVKKDNGNQVDVPAEAGQLAAEGQRSQNSRRAPYSLRSRRAEVEIQAISEALHETDWNRKQAARLLSISYRGLLYKIRRYEITRRTEPVLLREDGQ